MGDFFILFISITLEKPLIIIFYFVCEPQKCFYICIRYRPWGDTQAANEGGL